MKQNKTVENTNFANSNSILPYNGRDKPGKRDLETDDAKPETISKKGKVHSIKKKISEFLDEDTKGDLVEVKDKASKVQVGLVKERPRARLSDLAGIDSVLGLINELVFYPIMYPQLYSELGLRPPCGILLNGPSGCGKTLMALAIAGELGLPFFRVSGPELVSEISGY